jgi:Rab3 GTPase-activating protein catalytic subunit
MIGSRRGHKDILPNAHLLHNGEPVWIPITQDHGYMTDDMLREQAETLESLGNSKEGTELRAQMQSRFLVSGCV